MGGLDAPGVPVPGDKFRQAYGGCRVWPGGHGGHCRVDLVENPAMTQRLLPGVRTPGGMLPLAKSKMGIKAELTGQFLWITPIEGYASFTLPGNGLAYTDEDLGLACGTIMRAKTKGCLEVQDHNAQGFDFDHSGKIFIRLFSRTCFRAECPTCYEAWVGKLAGRVEHRILKFIQENSPRSKAIHFIASVPKSDWGLLDAGKYPELRRKAYKLSMLVGLRGGCIIFHPWRYACLECGSEKLEGRKTCPKCGSGSFSWYLSPHFHMIGLGWIDGVERVYQDTGWVLKNLGVRESIFRTAQYALSHCGIHDSHHTVVWFGVMGYRNYKAPKLKAKKPECPICDRQLQPVAWGGIGSWPIPQPEKARGYFLEARAGWVYVGYNLVGH